MNHPSLRDDNAIPPAIERWLQFMTSGGSNDLIDLLAVDAVFYSPAVYAPQKGRDKVASYLIAAERMFAGSDLSYTDTWYSGSSAVLQFGADLEGAQIEGVDIIQWNSEQRITSFKVMIRPLRGIQTVIPIMGQLLNEHR